MTAPTYRSRCQLTGNPGEACQHAVELAVIREAMAAAVGFYDCPCGAEFELNEFSSIEDYAGLNRWLGVHFGSGCMAQIQVREQAAEIRSLNAQRAQAWRGLLISDAASRRAAQCAAEKRHKPPVGDAGGLAIPPAAPPPTGP
ncbi:MAG: hypothetical protein ACPGVG_15670, partial [Mycobacterium sp.]